MAVDKYGKQYCINNLVAMIVETLSEDTCTDSDAMLAQFTQSKTYELLCDVKTGLWTQGPDYIISI